MWLLCLHIKLQVGQRLAGKVPFPLVEQRPAVAGGHASTGDPCRAAGGTLGLALSTRQLGVSAFCRSLWSFLRSSLEPNPHMPPVKVTVTCHGQCQWVGLALTVHLAAPALPPPSQGPGWPFPTFLQPTATPSVSMLSLLASFLPWLGTQGPILAPCPHPPDSSCFSRTSSGQLAGLSHPVSDTVLLHPASVVAARPSFWLPSQNSCGPL